MAVVVSRRPALYIPERELVVRHTSHRTLLISLADIVRIRGDVKEAAKTVLSNLLTKLRDLSISFGSIDVALGQDEEVSSWRYAIVKVGIDLEQGKLNEMREELINHAFSGLSPSEATKVLLVLNRV
jgi:hypothetical protein